MNIQNGGQVAHHPPTYIVAGPAVASQPDPGCCATPGATPAVKRTRGIAIAIIVLHSICLMSIGFILWAQWTASLAGIIMASILLCVFQKCCYIAAAIVFGIGGILDIVAMMTWIAIAQAFDEAGEGSEYNDDVDKSTDQWGAVAAGLALPPAIAALLMFMGCASAIHAVMTWHQIEAQAGPSIVQTTYPAGGNAVAHGTIPVNGQPPYAANVAGGKGLPPSYTA